MNHHAIALRFAGAARLAVAIASSPDVVKPATIPEGANNVSLRSMAESVGSLRNGRIDRMRVTIHKRPRRLVVAVGEIPLKTYRIELGRDPDPHKERVGDGRTPEGDYYICERREATRYHRALLLSYPNAADAARGLAEGLISAREATAIRRAIATRACPPQNTALGGMILIHGQHPKETAYWEEVRTASGWKPPTGLEAGDRDPDSPFVRSDWTLGCIGLRNQDIRELFDLLPPGTPVTIRNDG